MVGGGWVQLAWLMRDMNDNEENDDDDDAESDK